MDRALPYSTLVHPRPTLQIFHNALAIALPLGTLEVTLPGVLLVRRDATMGHAQQSHLIAPNRAAGPTNVRQTRPIDARVVCAPVVVNIVPQSLAKAVAPTQSFAATAVSVLLIFHNVS